MTRPQSLRRQLLVGILLPTLLFVGVNTYSLHRQALAALHTAYDRTLLASAKTISEQLDVRGWDDMAELRAIVPYAALEAFEADNQSRMFYRVSNLRGDLISGFAELPAWHGTIPQRPPYAALVDFYDDRFRDQPVRVAVLLQPVASSEGRGMAVIQVAETLELREAAALQILHTTLARQALLLALIAGIVVLVVQRATQPVRQLSSDLQARTEGDLAPLAAPTAPRELQPLIDATNAVMQRLSRLLAHQQRFVRDASHQLRTPLAVLKTQVQSALRGDLPPTQALREIGDTVDRATQLANQMLALAKVEQLRQQGEVPVTRLDTVLREMALELSPLIAQGDLDFGITTDAAPIHAHEWMLRELCRNLLHNAIRHAPPGTELAVTLHREDGEAVLTLADAGPGIDDELAARLFQPFSAGDVRTGSGLGLAICQEIVHALGGSITLANRQADGRVLGLDAVVRLPLADA
ncbi:sensor histidine kinase N-terminal domain-containing protein [Diaphorobacter sp. C33]|uniref:histidine kinase n=1 Tax=Diaphorobacter nitroreducens TaxID=164759 RepID=A0AAX1WVY0_9BURK|nr:sensor histidine kinase [Diaphorobacter sp. C33]ROR47996.1 two-component system sensor histidine kinase TctE [Diaphorobacter nitroreducens]WKK90932.1 sensor histidine kinase N-terminal domain-containing protein [Diaphorobacter sp. C33]